MDYILSPEGEALIKEFESLSLKAYICPAGKLTVGWGSTGDHISHLKVGEEVTLEQAQKFFTEIDVPAHIMALKEVKVPLTQPQVDALTSFIFNVGVTAFKRSTLLKLLNQSKYNLAAKEFLKWRKANGKVLRGLVRRREAEKALFEKGIVT